MEEQRNWRKTTQYSIRGCWFVMRKYVNIPLIVLGFFQNLFRQQKYYISAKSFFDAAQTLWSSVLRFD